MSLAFSGGFHVYSIHVVQHCTVPSVVLMNISMHVHFFSCACLQMRHYLSIGANLGLIIPSCPGLSVVRRFFLRLGGSRIFLVLTSGVKRMRGFVSASLMNGDGLCYVVCVTSIPLAMPLSCSIISVHRVPWMLKNVHIRWCCNFFVLLSMARVRVHGLVVQLLYVASAISPIVTDHASCSCVLAHWMLPLITRTTCPACATIVI